MKAEAADYLARAHEDLSDARQIVDIKLAKVAARSAYYAAFHAAEALIFEETGKSVKTHRGVRVEFARLTKHEVGIPENITQMRAQGYQYKEICDYSTDPTDTISLRDAEAIIDLAMHFVRWIEARLA